MILFCILELAFSILRAVLGFNQQLRGIKSDIFLHAISASWRRSKMARCDIKFSYRIVRICPLAHVFFFDLIDDRRRDVKDLPQPQLDTTRKGRQGDGLNKIYGPEWGITELDFDADYKNYNTPDMKEEYDRANKGVKSTGYRASRPEHQSVSGFAWLQEVRKDVNIG